MQRIYSKLLLLTLFSTATLAQEQIGVAAAVNRNTTDLTLEQERKLVEAGYQIIQNHTIETDDIGKAQMLLLDGTAFSVGPNSSVVLDRFIYNPETEQGFLEVTARGLFRIVGGKVTKKQPALIRTNSATVGIRGGIGIVQTDGSKVNATFLYGDEMTVTPNCVDLDTFGDQCSNDFVTTITEPGFSVSVESADSEPSEPEPVTEETLVAVQDELEASEEEPVEEESSSEESTDQSLADGSGAEESSSDESVASDDTGDSSSDEPTTEVAQDTETETETEVADAGDSSDIEVNEDLLDSSGVSDVSSDVAPDELGTADAYEVETEVDLVDVDDSPAEDVNEEVADTAQETTAEVAPTEVAPVFEVEIATLVESVDENTTEISLTEFVLVNPGEQNYSVAITGEGSEAFTYNLDTNSLEITEALDHESQETVELAVTFTSDNGDVQEFALAFNVTDVDEPATIAANLSTDSFDENAAIGASIATINATDPEGSSLTYTLSGTGSENFTIDTEGSITLINTLDYETATSYELIVAVDDGTNVSTEVITVSVTDINETPTLNVAVAQNSVQENAAIGTTIATSTVNDPEAGTVTYSLSGTGSENFSVSSDGTVTLVSALDYQNATAYEITLTASDGDNSVSETFTINVGDINEVPTLTTTLAAASFAENVAIGTTIATSSASDPESSTISFSLSGSGSDNFSVDANGSVTLANNLDYETATSYTITLTASDGTNSVQETITINVSDVFESGINNLSTTLANGGAAIAESSGSGTVVASSSINNPDGETITYSLSGTGSENFSVDSSGNVTTNASFDYETAQSYTLTLTATAGSTSVTDNFTVNIANEIEFTSGLLRYSAAYNSASRNGFSATATRGPSGSNLPAYYLEQVGDNTSSSIRDADASTGGTPCNCYTTGDNATGENGGVYVNIGNSNTANVFYTFPLIVTDDQHANGNRPYIFRGNNAVYQSASVSNVSGGGTNVSINTSGIISGGRTGGRTFWFMTTDNTEDSFQINSPAGTYNFFEDQVTLAGLIFPDSWLENYLDGNKRVFAMAVSPIESFNVSTPWHQDYFYPNFIPINLWSYGDVGLNYCNAYVGYESECADLTPYGNYEFLNNMYYYLWSRQLWQQNNVDTSRFRGTVIGDSAWNRVPEGQSLWWQVLNPNGVGVGLWVQISFKDSYAGPDLSRTRMDQESLFNVIISNVDYRKNDTTRYTPGDTGMGMDGYHYWSYQGPTNADNDGLGVNYGTSTVECATSNETGCFWAWNDVTDSSFLGAMITSSDPYKSGDMTLSVNYNSNTDTFSTSSFNVAVLRTGIDGLDGQQYTSVALSGAEETNQWAGCNVFGCRTDSVFRASRFYESTASTYNGFFSGILEFDVSGAGNSQLAAMRSSNTLASFTFDTTNDDLQVVAPMTISAAPSNNYTSNWTTVDTGSMTLKFGDATNDEAKSAYISSEVFAAEIQDDGAQIDGSSGGSNNLTGVMVSYNTLDKEDSDLFHSTNASMPNTAYSTWGFWAMSSVDISPNAGAQNASVHLGTWVGGETLAQNEIPTSGTASMSGAAVMKVASRHLQTGTNYDVHKYTTTADVSATFNWGASGYSGTLEFSNYDNFNGIVVNAGFVDFTVAIAGTDHTYTGNSTDTLTNGWLGGATVAGALYGGTTPDESGGRITVNLYKSGDISTSEANDFYMAEGIYLLD